MRHFEHVGRDLGSRLGFNVQYEQTVTPTFSSQIYFSVYMKNADGDCRDWCLGYDGLTHTHTLGYDRGAHDCNSLRIKERPGE